MNYTFSWKQNKYLLQAEVLSQNQANWDKWGQAEGTKTVSNRNGLNSSQAALFSRHCIDEIEIGECCAPSKAASLGYFLATSYEFCVRKLLFGFLCAFVSRLSSCPFPLFVSFFRGAQSYFDPATSCQPLTAKNISCRVNKYLCRGISEYLCSHLYHFFYGYLRFPAFSHSSSSNLADTLRPGGHISNEVIVPEIS